MSPERVYRNTSRLVFGLVVILLGVLFTLDKLEYIDVGDYWAYWPVLLIAVGLGRLLQPRACQRRSSGLVWIAIGTVLLLVNLGVVSHHVWNYWPVLLVLAGASMVWRAIGGPSGRRGGRYRPWVVGTVPDPGASPEAVPAGGAAAGGAASSGAEAGAAGNSDAASTVSAFSVLGGVKRRCVSPAFRGGDLNAIMGGCELDLRQASIANGEAVIDAFAMWGGIEIRVPDDWTVVVEGVPILGAFVDKTVHTSASSKKVLVIRGAAIMGGVEVKN
jgi:predicted membrane protein